MNIDNTEINYHLFQFPLNERNPSINFTYIAQTNQMQTSASGCVVSFIFLVCGVGVDVGVSGLE